MAATTALVSSPPTNCPCLVQNRHLRSTTMNPIPGTEHLAPARHASLAAPLRHPFLRVPWTVSAATQFFVWNSSAEKWMGEIKMYTLLIYNVQVGLGTRNASIKHYQFSECSPDWFSLLSLCPWYSQIHYHYQLDWGPGLHHRRRFRPGRFCEICAYHAYKHSHA